MSKKAFVFPFITVPTHHSSIINHYSLIRITYMTPERWQRINEMFHAALVLDGQERSAFLVAQSAGDDALRAKVAALLASHDRAEGFIQGSVFGDAAQLLVEDEAEAMIGQHIGLYKVDREIGRGGMGSVYLATRDDDQFEQQVAIKVVRRGMDTDLVLARFRNERQILAGFAHPNIARLFDGGSTETGLPYFIMGNTRPDSGREIDCTRADQC